MRRCERPARPRRSLGDDRGYVTAEAALVTPCLLLLLALLLWGLLAGAQLILCWDGAQAGARAAARGESPAAVTRVVRAVAPRSAKVDLSRSGDLVHVWVTVRSAGPGPLTVPLRARAVAYTEQRTEPAP